MYCAQCGSAMSRLHGAWAQCCNGWGYWWHEAPLPADLWFGTPQHYKGHWLYKTVKWPNTLVATPPRLEE